MHLPNARRSRLETWSMEDNEFEQRRRAVSGALGERKLDALLVSFSPNLRYLSGFTGSNGALLMLPDRTILFTDPRYRIRAARESAAPFASRKGRCCWTWSRPS